MLCVLAVCVGLQGMALSAQRALGHAHYHLSAAQPMHPTAFSTGANDGHGHHGGRGLDEHGHAADHAHDVDSAHHHEAAHLQGRAHSHASLANHDHPADDVDVVYVADDGRTSPPGHVPTMTRSGSDLDGMMPRLEPLADPGFANRWPHSGASVFRSRLGLPLERPPRT